MQLVLSIAQILAEDFIFLPKHVGVVYWMFIYIWCGTFGWCNKKIRWSTMHGVDNLRITAAVILKAWIVGENQAAVRFEVDFPYGRWDSLSRGTRRILLLVYLVLGTVLLALRWRQFVMPLPVLLPGTRHWCEGRASVGLDPMASHICSWLHVHCSLTRHIASAWPPLLAAVWYCLTDGPRVMNWEGTDELSRSSALSLGQQRIMFTARVLTDFLFSAP